MAEPNAEDLGVALADLLKSERPQAELSTRAQSCAATYDWSVVAPRLEVMYGRTLELSCSR